MKLFSYPKRDGGWVHISLVENELYMNRGEEYYVEINYNGQGAIYPIDVGIYSFSDLSNRSYHRNNENNICILESQGDWNIRVIYSDTTSGLSNTLNTIPARHYIYSNYPNPFNPITTFPIVLNSPASINLLIYDLSGREIINKKVDNLLSGYHEVKINMANYSSGVYLNKVFINNNHLFSGKMLLLK